jgi:hypothetical protein
VVDYPQQSSNFECGYIICGTIQILTLHFTNYKTGDKIMPLIGKQFLSINEAQLGMIEDFINLSFYTFLLNFFNDHWIGPSPMPDIPHMNNFEAMYKWTKQYIKSNYS